MRRLTHRSTRTYTLLPYTTLFRSREAAVVEPANGERAARRSERIVVLEADARQHVDDVVHGLAGHLALDEFLRQHGLGLGGFGHLDAADIADALAGDDDLVVEIQRSGDRKSTRLNSSH